MKHYKGTLPPLKKFLPLSFKIFLKDIIKELKSVKINVSSGGLLLTLKKKLPMYLRFLSALLISIPMALLFVIISPVFKIRLIRLLSERIGHFGLNTEIMLCAFDVGIFKKHDTHSKKIHYFFYTHRLVSNTFLFEMWKRVIPIISFPVICLQIDKIISCLLKNYRNDVVKKTVEDGNWLQDPHRLIDNVKKQHVFFTPSEQEKGLFLLKELGLTIDSRYICLAVRDSTYLKKFLPDRDWSYHDYRDASIQNYEKAALWLVEQGYFVIRMGKYVKGKFNIEHPRIIDYAMHSLRCDFLDIYLSSRCEFFISTSTGIDAIPQLFRRPLLFTNVAIPIELQTYLPGSLFIPKKMKSKKTGNLLSFKEMHSLLASLDDTVLSVLKRNQVVLLENTDEEILAVVQEMVKSSHAGFPLLSELQVRFLEEYCLQSIQNLRIRIGSEFVRCNLALLSSSIGVPHALQ